MAESVQKTKIGVIGAGPAGIFTLRALQTLDSSNFEVKCFERYSQIGGMWNFTGAQHLEDDGLERHSGLYYNLRTNNPKYGLETPEFSLSIPGDERCFLDGDTVLHSLQEFVKKMNIQEMIRFNCWVKNVGYDDQEQTFSLTYSDLKNGTVSSETLDYVIIAVGQFRYPNQPNYPGQETFPGEIIHSRDFLDARKFKGKRILAVGASFSGQDIAIEALNEGASKITVCKRGEPSGLKWPTGISEKPILEKIERSTVLFSDGTTSEYDVIIYCTGYKHEFPFLEEKLHLQTKKVLVPPLYKRVVMPSNKKLFYIGMQTQVYSFSMFWLQGHLCAKIIQGNLEVPSMEECLDAIREDQEKEKEVKSVYDKIQFQSAYVNELASLTGQVNIDLTEMLQQWVTDRFDNIATFRDKIHFKSKFH